MKLKIVHYFDAAHQLQDSPELVTKACARLHGHTYKVIVEVEAHLLNRAGMVIDFKAIKNTIDELDHQFINDIFKQRNVSLEPTAENIAMVLAKWITEDNKVTVTSVAVCEGYKGEDKASYAIYELED